MPMRRRLPKTKSPAHAGLPSASSDRFLEDDLGRQLEDPRVESALRLPESRREDQLLVRERAGDVVEGRADVVEVCPVKDVEALEDQLKARALAESKFPRNPGIKADKARTDEGVSPEAGHAVGESVAVVVQVRANRCRI